MAGRRGDDGVAVLMRYTLRLLTLQQFQRAAALLCACELRRRKLYGDGRTEDQRRWGATPFRIGLWVGPGVDAEPHRGRRGVGQAGAPARRRRRAARRRSSSRAARGAAPSSSGGRDIEVDDVRRADAAVLLRRHARPVPVHARATARTRGCRSWWSTRRSTGCCRRC